VFEVAFPAALNEAVSAAAALMPAAAHEPSESFAVQVGGERVEIPYRIYNPEPPLEVAYETHRTVLACLSTRHHDGRVRQRHLGWILPQPQTWVVPFVVQLVGEYVVEIVLDIQTGLAELDVEGSPERRRYGAFVADNPAFVELTAQRVASYWDCYYRYRYPRRADYPGFTLLSSLRAAGAA